MPRTPNKSACDLEKDLQVEASASNHDLLQDSHLVPGPISSMSPNTFSQQYSETPSIDLLSLSGEDLARGNILSLRSPPLGSLADELITYVCISIHMYGSLKSLLTPPSCSHLFAMPLPGQL